MFVGITLATTVITRLLRNYSTQSINYITRITVPSNVAQLRIASLKKVIAKRFFQQIPQCADDEMITEWSHDTHPQKSYQ